MRGRLFHWPAIARALAFAAVAAVLISAVIYFARQPRAARSAERVSTLQVDALSVALARCQAMGERAENDPACLAAWAKNRQRFFNYSPAAPTAAGAR
jgi:conjugative transfer region protein TrbK